METAALQPARVSRGWLPPLLGAYLATFDGSVVVSGLPALQRAFNTNLAITEWVSLSYSLILAAGVLAAGVISDRYGARRIYLIGFATFMAASLLAGASPDLAVLLVARALQAVGACALQANSISLIFAATREDPHRRRSAMRLRSVLQQCGIATGPVFGGLLVIFGWRWLFWAPTPICAAGLGLGLRLLVDDGQRSSRRIDLIALFSLIVSVTAAMLYLSLEAGRWTTPTALALLAGAGTGACGFLIRELGHRAGVRRTPPLLGRELLTRPGVGAGLAAGFLFYAGIYGALAAVPAFLEHALGLPPRAAGLITAAMPVASMAAALGVQGVAALRQRPRRPGRVSLGRHRRAARAGRHRRPVPRPDRLIIAATVSAAGGGLLLAALERDVLGIVAGLVLAGVAQGVGAPVNDAAAVQEVPASQAGTATSLLNTVRSLATASGVAVVGVFTVPGLSGAVHGLAFGVGLIGAVSALGGLAIATGRRRRPDLSAPELWMLQRASRAGFA